MKIKDLTISELYEYLKIADILSTKYFRESNFNNDAEAQYLIMTEIYSKLCNEANKRLIDLK